MLGVLLSSEMKSKQKKQILQEDFGIGMTNEIESEVENMCNLSELVERQGIQRGIEQGIEQGIERGILETNISAIKNLMNALKLTAEQAMEILKIPVDERGNYLTRL